MNLNFIVDNALLIAVAVTSGLMLIWPYLSKGTAKRLTVAQTTRLLNQSKAVLVDIRTGPEREKQGLVPNAKLIELDKLNDSAGLVSKNKAIPVVVLCQDGMRSGAAVRILKGLGFTEVFALDGGVKSWKDNGLPIRKVDVVANDPVLKPQPAKLVANASETPKVTEIPKGNA